MSPSSNVSPASNRRPLVLDAWPLLVWLCSRYLGSKKARKGVRDECMREVCSGLDWTPVWQERFDAFLEAGPALFTTSHVLVEVLRLQREHSRLYGEKEEFRRFAVTQLASVEERSVTLQDLRNPPWEALIVRHGLTDAGIVYLARQTSAYLVIGENDLWESLPSDGSFEITHVKHL